MYSIHGKHHSSVLGTKREIRVPLTGIINNVIHFEQLHEAQLDLDTRNPLAANSELVTDWLVR